MRLFRKPERVEFSIQHGEHLYLKASGPGIDVLPTASKWLADNPAVPKPADEEPKLRGVGFTATERRHSYNADDTHNTKPGHLGGAPCWTR